MTNENALVFLESKSYFDDGQDIVTYDDAEKAVKMAQQEILNKAYTQSDIESWYLSSIDHTQKPVWTEEHIDELMNDFILIPKDSTEE